MQVVYFGSVQNRGRALVDYLSEKSGSTIPLMVNPANWMLNVLGATLILCSCVLFPTPTPHPLCHMLITF